MGDHLHTDSEHHPPSGPEHDNHHHHDYSAANREHFDQKAKFYDERPHAIELAHRLGNAIRETYSSLLDEDSTMVLDYACGTGLMSRELCPHVKSIVGVDISQGMVDQYNLRVANQGLTPEDMKAIRMELKGDGIELDGANFDLIVCTASYHHFDDIDDTTRVLASMLKPGGSLLVADVVKDEEGRDVLGHYQDVVAHKSGFSEQEIRNNFEGAGLTEFAFTRATKARTHGNEVVFFLAKGTKARS